VSNFEILGDAVSFSCLVSFLTLGISAASEKGAVLYPFKYWIDNLAKKERALLEKLESYQKHRRVSMRQKSTWVSLAIEKAEWKLFYRTIWHKPLITCAKCMPSVWGTLLFFLLPYEKDIWVWLVGIPIASAINVFITKLYNKWDFGR
jgi:hypothetical protein